MLTQINSARLIVYRLKFITLSLIKIYVTNEYLYYQQFNLTNKNQKLQSILNGQLLQSPNDDPDSKHWYVSVLQLT